jgi:hypothetical protein
MSMVEQITVRLIFWRAAKFFPLKSASGTCLQCFGAEGAVASRALPKCYTVSDDRRMRDGYQRSDIICVAAVDDPASKSSKKAFETGEKKENHSIPAK